MSLDILEFPPAALPANSDALRAEVRGFLEKALVDHPMAERARSWTGVNYEFTRELGRRGWIGMNWPKEYGGHERSSLERYVVIEELLAAGSPVAAHWAADRQIGPMILRCGTEEQKRFFLPKIAAGECFFCLGMSESDAGSDLAAIRTLATRVEGGWKVNGSKTWTSGADRAHYMVLFCRTAAKTEVRHEGFSQLIVDMKSDGVVVTPIHELSGRHLFNQVFFEDVLVPDDRVVGTIGQGWSQVTGELSLERSGPDRFLSPLILLIELIRALGPVAPLAEEAIGRLVAHLHVLRSMSLSVAAMLETGVDTARHAAIVKDLGATFEQQIPEIARLLVDLEDDALPASFLEALEQTLLIAPAYPLRGGAREILRGVIARALGLR